MGGFISQILRPPAAKTPAAGTIARATRSTPYVLYVLVHAKFNSSIQFVWQFFFGRTEFRLSPRDTHAVYAAALRRPDLIWSIQKKKFFYLYARPQSLIDTQNLMNDVDLYTRTHIYMYI